MYPRLKLLQKLLAKDGIIAVSIDDNEVFHLGEIMNEIFGANNRLACAPWLAEPRGGKEKTKISTRRNMLMRCHLLSFRVGSVSRRFQVPLRNDNK